MKKVQGYATVLFYISCNDTKTSYDPVAYDNWGNYAGTKDGMRYSSNEQINRSNVARLEIAWQFSTKDKDTLNRSQNQCNPIIVNGILYGTSPKSKLFALNAATGKPIWMFDPAVEDASMENDQMKFFKVNRGVVYWEDTNGGNKRLFYNAGSKVYAIDAASGKPITTFATDGFLDLASTIDREEGTYNPFVANTSPGIIYDDKLILGSRVAESADAAPGDIQAFNTITGKREWIFHTIPHPGEFGYDTWPDKNAYKKLGGANSWAGMSLDEERGVVYVPTGSIAGDFYGSVREGENLFGNSLLALDAATGEFLWHFQTVHHDLWDRDLAANPNLVTLYKDATAIEAVAQITKQGYIFMFDRETGDPIFPIDEVAVSQDALPGEKPWPTQPIPTLPEPFARQNFDESQVTDRTPEVHKTMLERYRQVAHKEAFHPPSKEGNWIFPGFDGGGEWGGAAVDPETQILYVNSSEMPWAMVMVDVPKGNQNDAKKQLGRQVYDNYCIACHAQDLKGNASSIPSLVNVQNTYDFQKMKSLINNGINMMPAFSHIPEHEKDALTAYLLKLEKEPTTATTVAKEPASTSKSDKENIMNKIPYQMAGYNRFLDDEGYPGIKPPWGTLNAVNLNTGKLLWKVPLGEYPELTAQGIAKTGTENYGGPAVTKGGLVFIAATKDSKIRAFDKTTGKELWEANLPVPGYATPAIYNIEGKQYVVIACGGGKIGSDSGDSYVAFSLPETQK